VSAGEIRAFLSRHGLLARRDLGQSFLADEAVAARLVAFAGVEAKDFVIEIGTGLGILTRALASIAKRVLTIEVDAGLVRVLRSEGALPQNVELLHADARLVDLAALARSAGGPARVVANLPYAVASPLLRHLLDARDALVDWSVLLQREVAARLLARPARREYGSLSVLHQLCVSALRGPDLPPRCFFPPPQVVSRFVRLVPLKVPLLAPGELNEVEQLARAAFGQRRKTLVNALRGGLAPPPATKTLLGVLAGLEIDPETRAERLAPECFVSLARRLRQAPGEAAAGLIEPA
jgi:16S rRNA (adenine1518-N6/adenine1519-N6)-dimethyltransferase